MFHFIGRVVGDNESDIVVSAPSLEEADLAVLDYFSNKDLEVGAVVETITPREVIVK